MKKVLFSCPTTLLKRPIAEIMQYLRSSNPALIIPNNVIHGIPNIHLNKIKNLKLFTYKTINPPIISFEWPIPINPFFFVKFIKLCRIYDIIHMWVPFYISNTIFIFLKKIIFPQSKLYLTMDTFPGKSFELGFLFNIIFKIYFKFFIKFISSSVNKLTIYSNSMMKFALALKIPREKIEIIPTGIEILRREQNKNIRKEFSIQKDQKLILYVGLVNSRKNVNLIVKIAEKLRNNNYIFLIVGDGPLRTKLEKEIEQYKLRKNIIITGFRNDVFNFYEEADLFLFPSKGEGLPGVLLESMLYEIPIVASDILGNKVLIKNNFNGFLCSVNNVSEFSKKIKLLLENNNLRNNFIKNSKKILENRFNWESVILKYKKLYSFK